MASISLHSILFIRSHPITWDKGNPLTNICITSKSQSEFHRIGQVANYLQALILPFGPLRLVSHCAKLGEYNTDFHLCLRESTSDVWCKNTGQWFFLTNFEYCALVTASLWGIDLRSSTVNSSNFVNTVMDDGTRLLYVSIPCFPFNTYLYRPVGRDQHFAGFEKNRET